MIFLQLVGLAGGVMVLASIVMKYAGNQAMAGSHSHMRFWNTIADISALTLLGSACMSILMLFWWAIFITRLVTGA